MKTIVKQNNGKIEIELEIDLVFNSWEDMTGFFKTISIFEKKDNEQL